MPKVPFDFSNLDAFEAGVLATFKTVDKFAAVEQRFLDFKSEQSITIDPTISFISMIPNRMLLNPNAAIKGMFKQLPGISEEELLPIEMTLADAFRLTNQIGSNKSSEQQAISSFMAAIVKGASFSVLQALKEVGSLNYIKTSPNPADRKHMKMYDGVVFVEKLRNLQDAQYSDSANVDVKAIAIFKDFLKDKVSLLETLDVNLASQSASAMPPSPTESATPRLKSVRSLGGLLKTFSHTKMNAKTLAEEVKGEKSPSSPRAVGEVKTLAQDPKIKEAADQFVLTVVALIAKDPEYVLGLMPTQFKQFSDFLTSKFLSEEIFAFENDLKDQGLDPSKSAKLADLISALDATLQASKKLENTVNDSVTKLLNEGLEGTPKKVAKIIIKGITENRAGSSSESATLSQDSQDPEVALIKDRRKENRRVSIARAITAKHSFKPKLR